LKKERNLRDKRKRRVGVTAGSRLIVGNRETGTPQIVTEIAAPLVLRTPKCTVVATATTECGWKHGGTGAQENRAENSFRKGLNRERVGNGREGRRARARMRRCLILRQGAEPPETPGPLSLGFDCTEGRKAVKGTLRRHTPPLTAFHPSEENAPGYEGKGAQERGTSCLPLVGALLLQNWRLIT